MPTAVAAAPSAYGWAEPIVGPSATFARVASAPIDPSHDGCGARPLRSGTREREAPSYRRLEARQGTAHATAVIGCDKRMPGATQRPSEPLDAVVEVTDEPIDRRDLVA